jgi:hypothetical protein
MRLKAILALAVFAHTAALSAAAFEGKITYGLTTGQGKTTEVTLELSGSKIRSDMNFGGRSGAAIVDLKAKTVTTLLPDRKAYMVSSIDQSSAAAKQATGTISKSGATDTIAGHSAEEWVYTDGAKRTSFWITHELGGMIGAWARGFSRVTVPAELQNQDGLVLRTTDAKGFKMEAEKVEPGPVDASRFEVPDGYTKMAGMGGGAPASGSTAPAGNAPASVPDMSSDPRMQKAMENMTPEQKAMMLQMMQKQAGQSPAQ